MAYGAVYGGQYGARYGALYGPNNGFSVAFAPVAPGPGAVLLFGQSNAGGPALAAAATSFPGIQTPYANVQLTRRGAALNATPTWFSEGPITLRPRVTAFGSFLADSGVTELLIGRTLDADSAGWSIIQHFLDGSGLEDNWLNPAYPTAQPQLMTQLFTEIDARLLSLGTTLKAAVWIQGEADSGGFPDAPNYYANLGIMFNLIRQRYGDITLIIHRLSDNFGTDSQSQRIRNAQESFVLNNPKARLTVGDDLPFFDTAHYTGDSCGTLGGRIGAAILAVKNAVAQPNPRWGAQSDRIVTASGTALGPLTWPIKHSAGDIGVIVVSATGANPFTAPAGWTEMTGSPQYSGIALEARLHVFWRRATSASEANVTFANPASGDSKIGTIFTIVGCAPTGNPFDVTAGNNAVASTAVTVPGLTTSVANCFVVDILAHRSDAAIPQASGWTNASLTSVTEQIDVDTTSSLGYGIAVASGFKEVAGLVSATTANLLTSVTQARLKIAFKP